MAFMPFILTLRQYSVHSFVAENINKQFYIHLFFFISLHRYWLDVVYLGYYLALKLGISVPKLCLILLICLTVLFLVPKWM